jgi:hypothetical protein
MTPARFARLLWAAPCSAVGLLAAGVVLLLGGRVQRVGGILEAAWRPTPQGRVARRLPFRAITLGHVVVAVSARDLDGCRAHELVHVRQYERWGVLFFPAYGLSSLWQTLCGRRPYWDNAFEVQARRLSGAPHEESP